MIKLHPDPAWWRRAEGVFIKIRDMEDDHLIKTVQMLERFGQRWLYEAQIDEIFADYVGETAAPVQRLSVQRYLLRVVPQYANLRREIRRRRLTLPDPILPSRFDREATRAERELVLSPTARGRRSRAA